MTARCALESLLSASGPVRVTVRPCCLAALVGRGGAPSSGGASSAVDDEARSSEAMPFVCAAADVELQGAQ